LEVPFQFVAATMKSMPTIESREATRKRTWIFVAWAIVILMFASQWYAYDATRGGANPFSYYLGWSLYMWALTPLILRFTRRHPIESGNWKRTVPLHVAVSVFLTALQISIETYIGWIRHAHDLSFQDAIRHYFGQHTQLSLLSYWVLVAAAMFYHTYDQARLRQVHSAQLEARLAETRLEMLRMQLQPHFLFNTLQAATMLIHDDPHGAEDILLRLSQLLRVSLDELHVQEISLSREIELLECYIGIQDRRFGDRLRFDLRIDDDVLTFAVPSFVLQPLVENAIRHGIGKHKESDVVSIRAFQKQNRLYLEVSNRTSSLADTPERLLSRGVGLSNTKERIEQLYGSEHSLQLCNLEPKGVCVKLSIPVRQLAAAKPVTTEEVVK
jgi:two-component system, LytTR family, sensor kinase